jgi:nucleotide-binding universal stress UspA family protein
MYKKIVVALDGSEVAEEVLPYVEDIGTKMNSQIVLLRVSLPPQVVEDAGRVVSTVEQTVQRITSDFDHYLSQVAARLKTKGLETERAVKFGDPAEVIVDYAREVGADLIAMCTHGRSGLSRWVYGSVADRVLRASSVPVLLIRWSGSKPE